jgi:hypothetical protein
MRRSPRNSRLIAVSFVAFVAALAGCHGSSTDATTTIARSFVDGQRIDMDWVRTWKDRARFECVASTSGLCQVVVFVSECPGPACRTRVLREFPLGAGEVMDLAGLPSGFRWCLSHGDKPVAPACSNL